MTDRTYRAIVRVVLGLFKTLDLRFDVVGQEHVPATGGGVVVLNHMGYLDFALGGAPFWWEQRRLVRFMAKKEVFSHPVAGPLMRAMRHIPVDRAAGAGSFRAAVSALRVGELVGVFPEGTISRSFCLKEFKSGAVRMARSAGVPVIPVTLWGNQRLWTKARKPTLSVARHTRISITIGEPMTPAAGADPNAELVRVMGELLRQTQARYPEHDGEDLWCVPAHLGGTAPTPEQAALLDAEEQRARAERRGS